MSLVFNMVGGGGGSLKDTDAILNVTVPTGSTMTATKGGVTLTPTMWVQAADATLDCALFSIPAAQFDATTPWTVTATLGTDSATATVLIDSNKQYAIEITYHFYLYNKGEEYTDLTGGWTGNGIFEKRSNGLFFQTTTNGSRSWAETVSRTVNFSPYTSIVFRCSEYTGVNANWPQFGILRSGQGIVSYVAGGVGSGPKTITLPCGTYTSGGIQAVSQNAGESVLIESVWLE